MTKFMLSCVLLLMPALVPADAAAPDPAVQALISGLGLRESATASRDLRGWSPPKKIVFWKSWPDQLEQYRAIAPEVEFVEADSLEQAVAEAVGAQALLGMCEQEILSAAPEICFPKALKRLSPCSPTWLPSRRILSRFAMVWRKN